MVAGLPLATIKSSHFLKFKVLLPLSPRYKFDSFLAETVWRRLWGREVLNIAMAPRKTNTKEASMARSIDTSTSHREGQAVTRQDLETLANNLSHTFAEQLRNVTAQQTQKNHDLNATLAAMTQQIQDLRTMFTEQNRVPSKYFRRTEGRDMRSHLNHL